MITILVKSKSLKQARQDHQHCCEAVKDLPGFNDGSNFITDVHKYNTRSACFSIVLGIGTNEDIEVEMIASIEGGNNSD